MQIKKKRGVLDFSWWYSIVKSVNQLYNQTVETNQDLSFSKDWILQEFENFNASVAIVQNQLKTIEVSALIRALIISSIATFVMFMTTPLKITDSTFFSHNFGKYRILGCNIGNFRLM